MASKPVQQALPAAIRSLCGDIAASTASSPKLSCCSRCYHRQHTACKPGHGNAAPACDSQAELCGHEALADALVEPGVVAGGEVSHHSGQWHRGSPAEPLCTCCQDTCGDVLHQRVHRHNQVRVVPETETPAHSTAQHSTAQHSTAQHSTSRHTCHTTQHAVNCLLQAYLKTVVANIGIMQNIWRCVAICLVPAWRQPVVMGKA